LLGDYIADLAQKLCKEFMNWRRDRRRAADIRQAARVLQNLHHMMEEAIKPHPSTYLWVGKVYFPSLKVLSHRIDAVIGL
jgi:lauroyl/myristoyl acyltransferase